jgi:hypothetical protein
MDLSELASPTHLAGRYFLTLHVYQFLRGKFSYRMTANTITIGILACYSQTVLTNISRNSLVFRPLSPPPIRAKSQHGIRLLEIRKYSKIKS